MVCGVLMVIWRAPERVVSRVFCSSYFCCFFFFMSIGFCRKRTSSLSLYAKLRLFIVFEFLPNLSECAIRATQPNSIFRVEIDNFLYIFGLWSMNVELMFVFL